MKRLTDRWNVPLVGKILLLLFLTACDHKELCMSHTDHAMTYAVQLQFQYDRIWHEDYGYYTDDSEDGDGNTVRSEDENSARRTIANLTHYYDELMPELIPALPEGIRCLVYDDDGERHNYNLPTDGGLLQLSRGNYEMLFYNYDSEYIVFTDDPEAAEITLTTRSRSRNTYKGSPFLTADTRAENTVAAPDMLYFGYVEHYEAQTLLAEPDTMAVEMRPLVCTYVIRCNFLAGSEYIALARGALAGMAGSVKLYNGETSAENIATVLFDFSLYDGYVQAAVNTFGVPGYQLRSNTVQQYSQSRSEGVFALNLEVRLTNGAILTFDVDVTDQVMMQPQGGVIIVDDLVIDTPSAASDDDDDDDHSGSSSGFDVTVEGWGEYQDYTLPIGY
jgi:hypothetical protein